MLNNFISNAVESSQWKLYFEKEKREEKKPTIWHFIPQSISFQSKLLPCMCVPLPQMQIAVLRLLRWSYDRFGTMIRYSDRGHLNEKEPGSTNLSKFITKMKKNPNHVPQKTKIKQWARERTHLISFSSNSLNRTVNTIKWNLKSENTRPQKWIDMLLSPIELQIRRGQ